MSPQAGGDTSPRNTTPHKFQPDELYRERCGWRDERCVICGWAEHVGFHIPGPVWQPADHDANGGDT
jgi:hypothetical protein